MDFILKPGDTIPINLTITGGLPDATPTLRILDASHTKVYPVAANEDYNNGAGRRWWHTGVTVDVAWGNGTFTIESTAIIETEPEIGDDSFTVTTNDIDDVKADTAAILVDTGTTIPASIDALPTAAEINTELTSGHGTGSWQQGGVGSGTYDVIINVKDDGAINVADATVTIHNAANDSSPIVASGLTDASGNVNLFLNGDLYIRVSKVGFNFTPVTKDFNADGTYNVTGTTLVPSTPSDPGVCRIRVYPLTLANADATGLTVKISTSGALTIVDDQLITNASGTFTEDATTTPDSYYYDAVRGAIVHIVNEEMGLDNSFTVPDQATAQIKADTAGEIILE